ncbi:Patched domain-containing protein 3 [Trichinella pseudospiralis]|uniref:Patched domain-containing protein 3 n=1 Tax=Trichinella pseudospiralis TaxID=6337 RepID=A0A0V0YI21_TRIPS|nr:Patched domain-containing protein 3 [Trichinella pseudospiralis]
MEFFEANLRRLSERYARIVYRNPAWFVVVPVVVGIALSTGLLFLNKYDNALYLYTPLNGLAKQEERVFESFWPNTQQDSYSPSKIFNGKGQCHLYVKSKNGSNLLTSKYLLAIEELNRYVIEDIQITDNGTAYAYNDICLQWKDSCYDNPLIEIFKQFYFKNVAHLNFSYPKVAISDQVIYVASTLGGVTVNNSSGRLEHAEAWLLIYQLRVWDQLDERRKFLWQNKFRDHILSYENPLLELSLYHDEVLDQELNRNAKVLAPRIAPSFILLLIFSAVFTFHITIRNGRIHFHYASLSPLVAIAGVFSAGLGVSTAIGLLSYIGIQFSRVVVVMPFLVVAVRIDNTFLMISALASIDRKTKTEDRVAEAMSEASVSIFLTVATDALSFAVGYITNFPAVQLFCLYTCTAILVTFVFQLTLLFALLVYEARRESKFSEDNLESKKSVISFTTSSISTFLKPILRPKQTDNDQTMKSTTKVNGIALPASAVGNGRTVSKYNETQLFTTFFADYYAPFLMRPWVKTMVIILFFVYITVSTYGCMYIREGLEPARLLPVGSYALKHYRNLEKYLWKYGMQIAIVVANPGNLSDTANRERLIEVIHEFALSRHGIGEEGISCWLLDFQKFVELNIKVQLDEIPQASFYDYVKLFLSMPGNGAYKEDLVWTVDEINSTFRITAFRFMIGIKDFVDTIAQTETVVEFRNIASKYPEYNITSFNKMWHYVDQYLEIVPNIIQECAYGIMCMVILALLLIPKAVCSLWVTFSIFSIDMGVIGFMTLWGLNMDTISMITIIMSIGFSVDFSAHIAFSYSIYPHSDPVQRIRYSLGQLGWPILQGALSTLLGVSLLADLGSYMIISFFKTVFLVIISGLLHALIFLPVFLTLTDQWHSLLCKPKSASITRRNTRSLSTSRQNCRNSTEAESRLTITIQNDPKHVRPEAC